MNTRLTRVLLVVIVVALAPAGARAQWRVNGVPVGVTPEYDAEQTVVEDGAGGVIVTWRSVSSSTESNLRAQRVNALGFPLWGPAGVVVCNAPAHQFDQKSVSDGAGGVIVVWEDERNGSNQDDIYAQRLNGSGVPQWAVNGVVLCNATDQQYAPELVADGAGGAYVVWTDERNGAEDIYAQRINSAGVPQWTANGVGVCTASGMQANPAIVNNGLGEAVIVWVDQRGTGSDIYAQRLSGLGAALFAVNGIPISATNAAYSPRITSFWTGDFMVAWTDYSFSAATGGDVRGQFVFGYGATIWGPFGAVICNAPGDQSVADIQATDSGAIVVWYDRRNSLDGDIYAQHVDGLGAPMWMPNGVPVCTAPGVQTSPSVLVLSPPFDRVNIAWHDRRSGNGDIYYQMLRPDGSPWLAVDGEPVCEGPSNAGVPALVHDGWAGSIVAWADNRTGNYDVHAQRVRFNGQPAALVVTKTADDNTPGTLRVAIQQANDVDFPGAQTIGFDIPGLGPHVIHPASNLPDISDALIIDGFTQPGASPNTSPMGAPCDAQWVVHVDGQPNNVHDGLRFQAPGTVRGLVIENLSLGVVAQGDDVTVEGNYIQGCSLSGVLSVGNNTRIGGASPSARNVISGNDSGVFLAGNIIGTEVYGNYIGVDCDGVTPYGNAGGVSIADGPTGARVGSSQNIKIPDPQEANVIANNSVYGVSIRDDNAFDNLVIGNAIYGNGYQAIDLNVDGPTPNDPGDVDTGPNQLQNYPDIDYATAWEVSGSMSGAPSTAIVVHFYRSTACGDAKVFMGGSSFSTDGAGYAPFVFTPVTPIPPASYITATATDALGNTSELSPCVVSTNTPIGSDVSAPLMDANGVQRGVVTFIDVATAGNTYLQTPYTPPVYLSSDFYAGPAADDPDLYLDITTDAEYKKGIEVCLIYDPENIPGAETNLQLVHWNGLRWVAVTTLVDERNHTICGQVSSLSPFVIAVSTATGVSDRPAPAAFALHGNVPNPFNPVTTINYDIPGEGADVSIVIYDAAGRRVRELVNQHRGAGTWSAQWNGEDDRGHRVASGVYFYRMRAGSFTETRKMVLLK